MAFTLEADHRIPSRVIRLYASRRAGFPVLSGVSYIMASTFHTTTLGVRETRWDRCKLRRSMVMAETPFGPVRVKRAEGYGVVREKAEYEDLAALARKTGLSLEEIRQKLYPGPTE